MTATAWHGPLGAVVLPGGEDLDALQVWDDAVRRLTRELDAVTFRSPVPPDRLLVTVPAPLFAAWAGWAGQAEPVDAGTALGAAEALELTVEGLATPVRVEPQTDLDRRFLGDGAVFVLAGDGGWCGRTVNVPVAEVVRRHVALAGTGGVTRSAA